MSPKGWPAAVFSLWILVISSRFINTAIRGLRSPFNPGNDIEWFVIWLVIATVLMILATTIKRAREIFGALLVVACFVVLILSGTLLAALVTAMILAVAHFGGSACLLLLRVDSDDVALTIPLGLIFCALGGFVLATLHILTPVSIALMLLAVAATKPSLTAIRTAGLRTPVLPPPSVEAKESTPHSLPLLLLAPVIFLNLTWAVVPEIQFDANNYHLAVSKAYLQAHGFIDLPYFFHSYFYRLIEMLFTIALALSGPVAAKLLSFAFGIVAAVAVFSLGKLAFDERTGAWAAAFFYTTPMVSWLSGTAYIDNAIAMLLAASLIAFLKWYRNREQSGWLFAAAILSGGVLASKVNGAFGLAAMLGVALWQLRRQPKLLATCALLFVIVFLPWYALTYHWTGNPVFPMLNGVFKSPAWDLENRVMDARDYGIGVSAYSLLRLPFILTWDTTRFGAGVPRGAAGIMLLFAFPFGAGLLGHRKLARILFATMVSGFLLWAVTFQNVRYYAHILPVVCVLGAATVFHFSRHRWTSVINSVCLASVLVFQFPATTMMFWNDYERFPVRAAAGIEPPEVFLSRTLQGYAAVNRLNSLIRPGERVLGVEVENTRFYLNAPLETLSDSTTTSVLRIAASRSGEDLFQTLRQAGFAYIFATRGSLENPPVWSPYLKREFLDTFATRVFADSGTVVYRLAR